MKRIISSLLLAGAALSIAAPQHVLAASGFIEQMPALVPDADRPGAMVWFKPGLDRAAYQKIVIEPITIFISPDSEYQGLDADALKALSDGFASTLTHTLEPEIPVLNTGGPGTTHLRAALTNVKLVKKKRGLLGYTPVGFALTVAQDVAGARISLKEAVLEVEMLDAATGERLGVLVDRAPASGAGDNLTWDAINQTFSFYAQRLKARMQSKSN
jgi:hypothetical protein